LFLPGTLEQLLQTNGTAENFPNKSKRIFLANVKPMDTGTGSRKVSARASKVFPGKDVCKRDQGCQTFLDAINQNVENVPNCH
jgi:hypothetical protein